MNPQADRMLAHFRLLVKIGAGGMGEVWRAVDTRLDRDVAIKFLPASFEQDPERLARFRQEAKTLAALNHPSIVTIYSVEEADGKGFFTMEMVEGQTLDQAIPAAGLPVPRILGLGIAISDALAAAHDHGIVHRDLKPGNIMVRPDGVVKILDFGLARSSAPPSLSTDSKAPTQPAAPPGQISGTVSYMAPEQLRGRPPDQRSDIFSLGILLYQMATGRLPFAGDTAADTMASILKDHPLPATGHRPELPRQLWLVTEHCLEKNPDDRPQTALDLRVRLEQILARVGADREEPASSVAVLPFADMSPQKDQDYFCDGIAEEIINALTRIQGLRVASRTSAFRFKTAKLESREIGRRLRVENLLEGSVRKAGDRLRITVQLISVADGYHLWSERFDSEMKDVFAIQDEIARNVVRALQLTLSPKESSALQKTHTRDFQAYDFYLRGRNYYNQYRRKGMEYALQMFHRAIEFDPEDALAHAGIADCCSFLYLYGGRDEEHRTCAQETSRKALDLDPESAQVHASRGLALSLSGRHEEAEAAFETAIRLDPSLFEALLFYARDCFIQGKLKQAADLYERAGQVRPEDYQSHLLVAQIYEDLDKAADAELSRREGLRIAEEHLKLNPDDTRALYLGANALVALGERDRGLKWARSALARDPDEPMLLYNIGCIHSLAGQAEEALECLERAVANGLTQIEWFEKDSNLDPLRGRERFQAILRRLEEITLR